MTGRPRTFDRDQALLVAMEHFWRDGYAGTSVADLTTAIGIKAPSLYAAFGSKDQLFEAAAGLYLDEVAANVDRALDQPTAREGVAELLRISAEAYVDDATPPGCFLMSEPRLAGQRRALTERVAARLERGRSDGDLPADLDVLAVAEFVIAVTAGMSSRARDGATLEELTAVARVALRALPGRP